MLCVKCSMTSTLSKLLTGSLTVTCIDDMLQVGYVAEVYKCNNCNGTICVEYNDSNISLSNIKKYEYIEKGK